MEARYNLNLGQKNRPQSQQGPWHRFSKAKEVEVSGGRINSFLTLNAPFDLAV
jgi:hypothetical protein